MDTKYVVHVAMEIVQQFGLLFKEVYLFIINRVVARKSRISDLQLQHKLLRLRYDTTSTQH